MNVRDLVELLRKQDYNLEVTITDGYRCNSYSGPFSVSTFEDFDGKIVVDIGVGGCEDE